LVRNNEENGVTFTDRVRAVTEERNSILCIGLDPLLERLPGVCRQKPEPLYEFCREIVEATADLAAAFKINLAFFEAHGSWGWRQLERLVAEIPKPLLRIADAKRGDIGSSSEMYARALFEHLNFDATTVNPLLGSDSVEPFLRDPEKGAFFLCLTSNPGAEDFQFFSDGSTRLHERILAAVKEWNVRGNAGVVVGATRPDHLRRLRAQAPELPFLVPGIGAQQGDLAATVRSAVSPQGDLVLINASRSILYCSSGQDFAEAARAAAARLYSEMNRLRAERSETKSDG
jgi:orotidine-5'-phosphate decarboxylase